jgi:uncharacterized membrane protein YecN with MAPEG domain
MSLQVTSLLAGLFSLLMVPLSLQVSARRVKANVASLGDGRDEILHRRIRAHGNFIEYAPTALIAVGLIEHSAGATLFVWCLASAFFLSRIGHAVGLLYMSTPALRGASMLVQHAAFLAAGVWLLARAL